MKIPTFKTLKKSQYYYLLFLLLILGTAELFWQEQQPAYAPVEGAPAHFYSNQIGDDLTATFTTAISNAKTSVTLAVYSLTDASIIESLHNKAQEGVPVRVICDAKASPYIDSKLGHQVATTRRFGPGLMHQKILLIDGHQVWIGSANMTTESLRMHGNLVMALDHAPLAASLQAKFDLLQVEGHDSLSTPLEFEHAGQQMELWLLPNAQNGVARLTSLIRSAKKSVRIAMFTWTRHDLAEAVIEAAKRGVQTEVVIDHHAGKGAGAKIVRLLKKRGVPIFLSRGGPLLHHKFVYIDQEILAHGSANWTKAAFTQNDDCFIVLHKLNDQQKYCMETVWKTIRNNSEPVKRKDER